jgi:hypothetical protein
MRKKDHEPVKVNLDPKVQNSSSPVLVSDGIETFFETPEHLKAHAAVIRLPLGPPASIWVSYRAAKLS